jgi:hypothetical protein
VAPVRGREALEGRRAPEPVESLPREVHLGLLDRADRPGVRDALGLTRREQSDLRRGAVPEELGHAWIITRVC